MFITWRACGYIIGVIVLAACVSNPFRLPFLVSEQTRREIVVVNCILSGCAGTLHYTIHPSPYTLHPTLYTLQPTTYIPHLAPTMHLHPNSPTPIHLTLIPSP